MRCRLVGKRIAVLCLKRSMNWNYYYVQPSSTCNTHFPALHYINFTTNTLFGYLRQYANNHAVKIAQGNDYAFY